MRNRAPGLAGKISEGYANTRAPDGIQRSVKQLSFCVCREMHRKRKLLLWIVVALLVAAETRMMAGDLRISLPKRGRLTPVQSLNRDGVSEIKHGHVEKAKRLFVRAYLLDPDD